MANYFSDFPQRWTQMEKYSRLKSVIKPLEKAFGTEDAYESEEQAMEFYQGALDEIGRYSANELASSAEAIDRQGVKLGSDGKVIYPEILLKHMERCAELGIFGGAVSRKYDGLNLPRAVLMMALELFAEGCPNTALTIAAYSMADFLERFGTAEQREKYLPKIITNEYQTSMALTEPNAGSDLGKLRTTGRKEGDHWVINGTKQFITNGDSHLVFTLVRTDPSSEGLRGLSVMIVPREFEGEQNVKVSKIEDKVCLHASPTCELLFENSKGELLGTEGDGFRVMADLMNGARLAMGALSVGIMARVMEESISYANTRVTMGQPIIKHPMVSDMIYEMDVEIRAIRAMVIEASNACDLMNSARVNGDEKEFKKWKKR